MAVGNDPLRAVQQMYLQGQGTARFHTYVKDYAPLTGNAVLTNEQITCDRDGYFFLERLAAVSTSTFRFTLQDVSGQPYSSVGTGVTGGNARVRNACIFGTASEPFILGVPIVFMPRGVIGWQIEDTSGASNTIHIDFIGFLFYPDTDPRGN